MPSARCRRRSPPPSAPDDPPIRVVVSREALINELHAYVTDPSPGRTRRLDAIVIPDLTPLGGRLEPVRWGIGSLRTSLRVVLDAMVLDGVRSRRHVAEFVESCSLFARPLTVEIV